MPFLKQTFMWIFFIVAMYFGVASAQSSSNALQGMGFVSVVMALVCLYIIFKLMWGARGTISTILIIGGVVIYSAYALGLFGGKTPTDTATGVSTKAEQNQNEKIQGAENDANEDFLEAELFGADVATDGDVKNNPQSAPQQTQPQPIQPVQSAQPAQQIQYAQTVPVQQAPANNGGLVGQLKTLLFGNQATQNAETQAVQRIDINPFDYPAISGRARVITGSVLRLNNINIKMYGIDAPDINQTCANHFGQGYYCGREAKNWLQNWLIGKEVTCHILGKVERGWATGACFVDNNKYDVAAVVVNAGWAVAFTQNTDVYVEYERQAYSNRRGLWNGTFYKPWDWRKIQNRKVKITVKYPKPKPAQSQKSGGFDFWGLF